MNIDVLYKTFLEKFESLRETYEPLKKTSENKIKFKEKQQIAYGLQKSISIRPHYLLKFIRLKNPIKNKKPK